MLRCWDRLTSLKWILVNCVKQHGVSCDDSNSKNINLLLTEREGRTREYWPDVVTVRTERSEVRTKTAEGQYSPVRLEQARLVSSLLYGTLFFILKCTSGGLHLKMFFFSIYLWNFGKISIFIASSDSFNVKNVNIHPFFFTVEKILNLPVSLQNKKYTDWTVSASYVKLIASAEESKTVWLS